MTNVRKMRTQPSISGSMNMKPSRERGRPSLARRPGGGPDAWDERSVIVMTRRPHYRLLDQGSAVPAAMEG